MAATKERPGIFGAFFNILAAIALSVLLLLRGEKILRSLLLYLSEANWARKAVSGTVIAQKVAGRFYAGLDQTSALAAVRDLQAGGLLSTMDFLGESVTDESEARAATAEIVSMLNNIAKNKLDAHVSVKLSQLGVKIDRALAEANLRSIVSVARDNGNFVRIDMEDSPLVDTTLEIYRTLRSEGFDNVGVVIQSYLFRSRADVDELISMGARVRLCKGAYAEPDDVAYARKADTDQNFALLVDAMLDKQAREKGVALAIATHDEKMISASREIATAKGATQDEYEFQMLYGIRPAIQSSLAREGFRVRIYVPYGSAWYPYFMRRLAERPANLWFFLSNLLRSSDSRANGWSK